MTPGSPRVRVRRGKTSLRVPLPPAGRIRSGPTPPLAVAFGRAKSRRSLIGGFFFAQKKRPRQAGASRGRLCRNSRLEGR
jgi:hypothetical protein